MSVKTPAIHSTRLVTNRAFTLVELLVCMAIMSLLIALLLPSLQNSRELARLTQCASVLRNDGVILQIYCQDGGNKYVPYCYEAVVGVAVGNRWWQNILARTWPDFYYGADYTKNKKYLCPADDSPSIGSTYSTVTSYGYNRTMGYNDGSVPGNTKKLIFVDDIKNPARYAVFLENTQPNGWATNTLPTFGDSLSGIYWFEPSAGGVTFDRHHGKTNGLLFDGHVAMVNGEGGTNGTTSADGINMNKVFFVDPSKYK